MVHVRLSALLPALTPREQNLMVFTRSSEQRALGSSLTRAPAFPGFRVPCYCSLHPWNLRVFLEFKG